MFKYFILKAAVFFFILNGHAYALSCVSGCGDSTVDISRNLTSDDNVVGMTVNSNNVPRLDISIRHSAGQEQGWSAYLGGAIPPAGTSYSDWQYTKIDDYISIALSSVGTCGRSFVPSNGLVSNANTCNPEVFDEGQLTNRAEAHYEAKLRIDKKMIGGSYSKRILLVESGRCRPAGCASKQLVTDRIFVNVNITVPQSCKLNAGQVIDIDFGNVSSGAFKSAGAIALGVQPKSRVISVECDNVAGNAQLSLRLQADKTNGNIVVSDENNDVGFRVTNNNGVPLVPNNLSSVIPFALDSNARQNVTIQAYPVSVTGNKPTEGPVTSRAYLRVDFP
ncbi:fimbrial protein [Serratia fonticola]|uniref:fimbrial protein n=1 Tax=Serratia fonticola TaxID=47917 RepID=UPI0020C5E768|nr:fimbrial protein [Serratia fonticola]CAI1948904.1 fimbrial-like adhesin [Serratia fonticola]CAI2493492.1 fimbrial-like adhesin [Serratia fonticola]